MKLTPEQIVAALQGLNLAIQAIAEVAEASRRSTEWTPMQETAWDTEWEQTKKLPAWQVRP